MDAAQERFELVNRLFSEALNKPPSERSGFVIGNCGEDVSLRDSVLQLLSKFENLGDFLEKPAGAARFPEAGFLPGTLLAERFRIEEMLGLGGMGEVYRARDLALGDTVALKAIRAEWRSNPSIVARFRDEIRLARRISSEHVCRLFDLFSALDENGSENLFFTMDFLDGEPLSAILQRDGALETRRLLRIAKGIAHGLDDAHRRGIVHRDLKPANIVIVYDAKGEEQAVITDFGLAKQESAASGSITQAGTLVGSPDYMAPEQFLNEPATPAADIFALGVIIYEMIAGAPPYPREGVVLTAIRRLTIGPTPLLQQVPAAPSQWERVLQRAMDRNPARRHASAGNVVRDLQTPRSTAHRALVGIRSVRISRRTAIAGGAAAVALSSLFGFLRFYQRALPDAPLIMLTPIVCPTSPEIARSVDIQLEKGLVQSAHVSLLPSDQIVSAWQRMGNNTPPSPRLGPQAAREIALRCAANFLLSGDLGQVGGEWVLTLRLELMGSSAGHPQEVFSSHFYAAGVDLLLPAAAKAVSWVRSSSGEPAAELRARSRPAEEVTTKSWEALKEYTAAKTAWGTRPLDRQWPPDQREAAEAHLARALQLDPDFAIAASLLADIQVASQQFDEGMSSYQRAAQLIDRRNLTDREALLIWGLFALDTGQFAKAEEVFSRYALQYPKEGLPLFHKARAVENQGNVEAALHLLDLALEKEPGSYTYLLNRSIRYIILGRFSEAVRDLDRAVAMNPGDWTDQVRSILAFAQFDAAGIWRSLERMRSSGSVAYRSKAYWLEACFRAEQGQPQDGEALLRQGLQFDIENRMPVQARVAKHRRLAQLLLSRGESREAVASAKRMLDEPAGMRARLDAGAILAQAGDLAAARSCLPEHLSSDPPPRPPQSLPPGAVAELRDWPIYWRRVLRLWAELALACGNPQAAFQLLRESPPGEAIQEWPGALIRAAIAAGERDFAARALANLFSNPAAYWVPVDLSAPGFMRQGIAQARELGLPERDWGPLARFLG